MRHLKIRGLGLACACAAIAASVSIADAQILPAGPTGYGYHQYVYGFYPPQGRGNNSLPYRGAGPYRPAEDYYPGYDTGWTVTTFTYEPTYTYVGGQGVLIGAQYYPSSQAWPKARGVVRPQRRVVVRAPRATRRVVQASARPWPSKLKIYQ